MDLVINKEAPMQILNLILEDHDKDILEGQLTEDDAYVDWFKCVDKGRGQWS